MGLVTGWRPSIGCSQAVCSTSAGRACRVAVSTAYLGRSCAGQHGRKAGVTAWRKGYLQGLEGQLFGGLVLRDDAAPLVGRQARQVRLQLKCIGLHPVSCLPTGRRAENCSLKVLQCNVTQDSELSFWICMFMEKGLARASNIRSATAASGQGGAQLLEEMQYSCQACLQSPGLGLNGIMGTLTTLHPAPCKRQLGSDFASTEGCLSLCPYALQGCKACSLSMPAFQLYSLCTADLAVLDPPRLAIVELRHALDL